MKQSYSEKLRDPRWQKRRLEIMQRDGFKCIKCDDQESTLHVHHVYYIQTREPWEYPDIALQTLCEMCHDYERCRPELCKGESPLHEWETALDFIVGNEGVMGESFLWDLGVEIQMAVDDGMTRQDAVRTMELALREKRKTL